MFASIYHGTDVNFHPDWVKVDANLLEETKNEVTVYDAQHSTM